MLAGEALAAFKRDYWHRQIKLFRAAINFSDYPIRTTKLLSLAANDLVESRLVNANYEVQHGPIKLNSLAEQNILILHSLESHIDSTEALLRQEFSFLPAWQIDDVMASIGNHNASCGPHFDSYDVFLVQLSGTKTWRLDGGNHVDADLHDNTPLRLLKTFRPSINLRCMPGDVLYIPPGVGHHGICDGESVTLSIGLRNPTMIELMAEVSEFILQESELHTLDSKIKEQGAKIDSTSIMPMIQEAISPRILDIWYGCYVTRLRNPDVLNEFEISSAETKIMTSIDPEITLGVAANRPTRIAWSEHAAEILLFVNGDYYSFSEADYSWIPEFCEARTFLLEASNHAQLDLTRELIEKGAAHLV